MTLTQTAVLTKRLIVISIATLILGIGSFIGYKIWYAYYLANLPPVEQKPDTKFGALPKPAFPKGTVSSSNFTYSLDTATGELPKIGIDPGFEKIIKVYFVTQKFATFLSPDRSEALAKKFGLTSPPTVLSEIKYKFSDQNKTLLVNLDSGNFSYTNEATTSAKANLSDDKELVLKFTQAISNLGVLKDDLKDGRSRVQLLKTSGTELIPTELKSEAQAAQISIWPASIDKKEIFTPNFNKSPINAIVSGEANDLDNFLSLDFTYYPVDTSTFATYPTKTTEEAFDDLKSGKGVIILEPDKPQASITSVSLGYYLPDTYTPYLQPIFVFEGPHFAAYISAINEQSPSQATGN